MSNGKEQPTAPITEKKALMLCAMAYVVLLGLNTLFAELTKGGGSSTEFVLVGTRVITSLIPILFSFLYLAKAMEAAFIRVNVKEVLFYATLVAVGIAVIMVDPFIYKTIF